MVKILTLFMKSNLFMVISVETEKVQYWNVNIFPAH